LISFRQHVVTLVAVFLALALGVVLGGGPLSEVGRDALTSTSARTKSAADNDTAAFGDAFATAAATRLYDEQLAGRPVALVSLPGSDQRIIDGLVGQVERAGGTLKGTYTVQRALVDPGEKSLVDTLGSQLMTQLDSDAADENAPTYERLGQLLGTAIATHQEDGADVGDDTPSIRQSLAGADLVVSPEQEVGRAPLVLVVLGRDTDDSILGGLVSGLASRALGVVVAGDTRSGQNGDIAALRKQSEAGKVTTVDGVELAVGQVTTTLALVRSLTDTGGSFGASGSDGAVPLR
jgi:Copper transport outer membrane protein, MctB